MTKSTAHPRKKKKTATRVQPELRPDAAGIDLGATVHYVAAPPERDAQAVRSFGTQTGDLHALADWLMACKIKTVAMEATGVYWVPLFQSLEERGLCPDNRITGGRPIGVATRAVANRLSTALRMAAQSLFLGSALARPSVKWIDGSGRLELVRTDPRDQWRKMPWSAAIE